MSYLIPLTTLIRVRRWKWLPWPKVNKQVPTLNKETEDKIRYQAIERALAQLKDKRIKSNE